MSRTINAMATLMLVTVSFSAAGGQDFNAFGLSRGDAPEPQSPSLPTKALPTQPREEKTEAKVCAVEKPILPLDHGPRAQTTPYENKVRMRKYQEAVAKNC
ncbi:hypothetical protein [Cupriavidus sp. SK-3]|uniref:hypothetical protein n=1 Tax=Cupriavidus sp. SK-3 TaxID=1470558 RepID=UPI00126940C5|nr:hypothetical protein [Cupriavidus sp. SK-3]